MSQAFVLRMKLGGGDRVPEALECNQIFIGWSDLEGLLNYELSWEEFRALVKNMFHPDDPEPEKGWCQQRSPLALYPRDGKG